MKTVIYRTSMDPKCSVYTYIYIYMWKTYQHLPQQSPSHVGKSSSTMEHLGIGWDNLHVKSESDCISTYSFLWFQPSHHPIVGSFLVFSAGLAYQNMQNIGWIDAALVSPGPSSHVMSSVGMAIASGRESTYLICDNHAHSRERWTKQVFQNLKG